MADLDDFFNLRVTDFRGSLGVEWVNFDPKWHDYYSFKTGAKKPKPQHGVCYRVTSGRRKTDFIGDDLAPLISEDAYEVFKKYRFSGWSTYPVKIIDRQSNVFPVKYFGLAILGRSGPMDMTRGVKETFKQKDGKLAILSMDGLFFDLESWDGSDFFVLKDSGFLLVTKRVVDALKCSGLVGWTERELKDVCI